MTKTKTMSELSPLYMYGCMLMIYNAISIRQASVYLKVITAKDGESEGELVCGGCVAKDKLLATAAPYCHCAKYQA